MKTHTLQEIIDALREEWQGQISQVQDAIDFLESWKKKEGSK